MTIEPFSEQLAHVVTVTNLRLRGAPSTSAEVQGGLPRGRVVYVLAQNGLGWTQVRTGTRIGWVASKYLAPAQAPGVAVGPEEEFPWMPIALAERGVREDLAPAQSNPRVLEYLRSTALDDTLANNDATPWCSGFVNWCVEHAGMAGTNSAAARSWLDWGRPLVRPRRGCVTVLSRATASNRDGAHVGFYVSQGGQMVDLLGGNQKDRVCVASYDLRRLLGYRVPR